VARPPEIRENVSLAPLTYYRIGGPARYYSRPETTESLLEILTWARNEEIPMFILGAGTNLLVSDRGYAGLVICLRGFKGEIGRPGTSGEWQVGSGALFTPWVRKTAYLGFAGVEALIGIPGTVGGALRMNAGAFSQEICQTLIDIEVIDNNLNIIQLNSRDIGFSYRRAPGLDDKIILQARFRLAQDDTSRLIEHIRQIIALRRNRQPLQWPSCGSVFKRPEGDYAGRLIEAAGLKGMTVGGAQIAEDHANFIINKKKAKSEDVLKLIKMAKKKVQEEFGVTLEREVILVGFSAEELHGA
jgi:UDP-N-acetylmuramate dehydrogenase